MWKCENNRHIKTYSFTNLEKEFSHFHISTFAHYFAIFLPSFLCMINLSLPLPLVRVFNPLEY
jgi:hypothetical protein